MSGYWPIVDSDFREGNHFDFSGESLEIKNPDIPFYFFSSNVTMSDKNGNLIFYTNGCDVANKNHEVMPNGYGLSPGDIADEFCNDKGYPGIHQSVISIPAPGDDSLYYIFHQRSRNDTPNEGNTDRILYSKVDMRLENGLGDIVQKNQILHDEYIQTGEMTLIKHSNGIAWWLIANSHGDNEYITFLIESDTITGPFSQNIGIPMLGSSGNGGSALVFSPDGSKMVRTNIKVNTYLYDFDRTTGQLSNFQELDFGNNFTSYGASFSPNGRFLYLSNTTELYQVDMEADDLTDSAILIDEWNGGGTNIFPTNFYYHQLGPDCRIYINCFATVEEIHIIHNPNEKGTACNFEQEALVLPYNYNITMAHHPNYRLDTPYPICDSSLIVTSTELFRPLRQQVSIFPNPTNGPINIHMPILPDQPMRIVVYNTFGQVVWSAERRTGDTEQQVDLSGLAAGIYVVQVDLGARGVVTEKVILK